MEGKAGGIWDKVSSLDTFTLSKIAQNADIPVEVIKQLKKFAKIDETKRVYLNKKQRLD